MIAFYPGKKATDLVFYLNFYQITAMSEMTFDSELDCRGLNCPLPVLKTKKALDKLSTGHILRMTATDPGSVNDVAFWARQTGNELLSQTEQAGVYLFYIRKQ